MVSSSPTPEFTFTPWKNPANHQLAAAALCTFVLIFFLSYFSTIFLISLLAIAITAVLKPAAQNLEKQGINAFGASVLIYFLFLFVLFAAGLLLAPQILSEIRALQQLALQTSNTPGNSYSLAIISAFAKKINLLNSLQLQQNIAGHYFHYYASFLQGAARFSTTFFYSIPHLLLFLIAVFFLLKDSDALHRKIIAAVPNRFLEFASTGGERIRHDLSAYFRRLCTIVVINATIYGLSFYLLGLPFPVLLGIFAGLTAGTPVLGSIIGIIPVALTGIAVFNNSAILFVLAGLFAGINFIQTVFFRYYAATLPVKIHPLSILAAIIIGATVWGVWGVVFAVPAAICLIFVSKQILWGMQNFHF